MTTFRHRAGGNQLAGDIWVCTFHSSSTADLGTVHAAWVTMMTNFITGTLAAMWNTHTSCTNLVTDQLDPSTGKNTTGIESPVTLVGTGTGGSPAPTNAMVVSMFTAIKRRDGRGRMFLPSPDDTHYTTGGLFVQADCQTVVNGFKAAAVAFSATSTPVIYHRTPKTVDNIVEYKVGDVPGNLRTRKNKIDNVYSVAP